MLEAVEIREHVTLDDYEGFAHLANAVRDLRGEARVLRPAIGDRTVWMVNSTARGGGVAEMLPKQVEMLRELGLRTEWLVLSPEEPAFFGLTKRIHNMIHGSGQPGFDGDERQLYVRESERAANELEKLVRPDDVLVIHDPQPLGAGALLKARTGVRAVWRCHIGVDEENAATSSAWAFLEPFASAFDQTVFSAVAYVPPFLAGKASVIHPAIDPLSHKNRELHATKLVGVLCNAGLLDEIHPVFAPAWEHRAQRLQADGSFAPATAGGGIGIPFRPIVTQVSRWDRLKGWLPLLEGFLSLKARRPSDPLAARRLRIARLVMAGPDPSGIQDDPEGLEVLSELVARYLSLTSEQQADVALVTLPMVSQKENALMVNALQRGSAVVVQNSLREGFGLTATEAMWKRIPVLGTVACGLREQIRDDIDGLLTRDPRDPEEIASHLETMLGDPVARERWGRSAQRRVHDLFLVFSQVREWLRLLARLAGEPAPGA